MENSNQFNYTLNIARQTGLEAAQQTLVVTPRTKRHAIVPTFLAALTRSLAR